MENNQEPFRYQIIRKINSGGMASVFLAIDSKLGREVALKKIHPHLLNQKETIIRFNLKGFIAGEFSIQYDSKVNISQGSIKTSLRGATLNSMVDSKSRHLKIAIAIKDDVDEDYPLTLASIILPPSSGISRSSVTIKSALLNEGQNSVQS